MREMLRYITQHRVAIGVIVAIVLVGVLVLLLIPEAYNTDWTGFNRNFGPTLDQNQQYRPEKTLWDWLQLLIVPLVLAIGGFWLSQMQKTTERRMTLDNQQENTLQIYLDRMSELLLKEELRNSLEPEKAKGLLEVRKMARTRTKVALTRLDPKRKGSVLKFLYESHLLLENDQRIVDISRAELDHAYLRGFNLREANLSEADLRRADLSNADLSGADLRRADLSNADLSGSDLSNAHLQGANLSGADLKGAYLKGANYNTETMQWKNAQGNFLTLEPTKWPKRFKFVAKGAICANC